MWQGLQGGIACSCIQPQYACFADPHSFFLSVLPILHKHPDLPEAPMQVDEIASIISWADKHYRAEKTPCANTGGSDTASMEFCRALLYDSIRPAEAQHACRSQDNTFCHTTHPTSEQLGWGLRWRTGSHGLLGLLVHGCAGSAAMDLMEG